MGVTVTLNDPYTRDQIHWQNITHNLVEMAEQAGIYEAIWRPYRLSADYDYGNINEDAPHFNEDDYIVYARDIISHLETGLKLLISNSEYYEQFNASNGWGTYNRFIAWVQDYLDACKEHPDLIIETHR